MNALPRNRSARHYLVGRQPAGLRSPRSGLCSRCIRGRPPVGSTSVRTTRHGWRRRCRPCGRSRLRFPTQRSWQPGHTEGTDRSDHWSPAAGRDRGRRRYRSPTDYPAARGLHTTEPLSVRDSSASTVPSPSERKAKVRPVLGLGGRS